MFALAAADTSDPLNRSQQTFAVTIAPPPTSPVVIKTTTLPDVFRGVAYSQTIAIAGGTAPFTWVIANGSLPPGLALSSVTGTIVGVPMREGTYAFTVRVTDSAVPATSSKKNLTIRVKLPAAR